MTERERLVEIIKNSLHRHIGKSCLLAENLADDILASDVVVLPCGIGDTLHDASEYIHGIPYPEIYELESDRMIIEKNENGDQLFSYDDVYIRHEDIGKTVFLSREEAEKALMGGAE